jgi:PadR family transcriptional regulator PadR
MDDRFLLAGLIRLHVLHHAVHEPVYGLAMIEELGRHGYKLSPGTLYPILHGLEERGLLVSKQERHGRSRRRVYTATRAGRAQLAAVKGQVHELFT